MCLQNVDKVKCTGPCIHPRMNNTCGRFGECASQYGSSDLPQISKVNVLTFQISSVLKCAERTDLARLPVTRESWLGAAMVEVVVDGDGGRCDDCTPEIKSSSLRTMAWNTPSTAAGSVTGCLMPLCFYPLFEMLSRITDSENMWVLC